MHRVLAAILGLAAYAIGIPSALTCGGLACSGGLAAVSQADERILFVREGETMTAVIQIAYTGDPADFGWILPIPTVPERIDVAPATIFNELRAATPLHFDFGSVESPARGCSCPRLGGPPLVALRADPSGTAIETYYDVDVWASADVGPYELSVISSRTPSPILEWVERHGYSAPPGFAEVVDDYVKSDYKFVLVRLQADAETGTGAIQPLLLQYRSMLPCIPLRLTATAADPEIGVRVWIAGHGRAVPLNYRSTAIDESTLAEETPATVRSRYDELVSDTVDAAGGRAWVTEASVPITSVGPAADEILGDATHLSRLYTRISPEEMTEDPFFVLDDTSAGLHPLPTSPETRTAAAILGLLVLLLLRRRVT